MIWCPFCNHDKALLVKNSLSRNERIDLTHQRSKP